MVVEILLEVCKSPLYLVIGVWHALAVSSLIGKKMRYLGCSPPSEGDDVCIVLSRLCGYCGATV